MKRANLEELFSLDMTNKASISLCMIARDEADWIGKAIQSVLPIVSEIILVDTGSQDGTVKIAQSLGAQVYTMPWKDDFSAPRNLSLQHATGEWILVLDADEVIAASDLPELVRLTQNKKLCIEFLQRHYTDDVRLSNFRPVQGEFPELEAGQGGFFESNLVRFFPNHCGIHYRGKVHELVEHSIGDIGKHTIVRTEVRIHHYGHTAQVKAKKNKAKLYTPLGVMKTLEQPRDWKNFFELGVEHNNNGRLEESVQAFQESVKLNAGYVHTWINMGYVQCELGQYQEASKSLQIAIKIDPKADEAYCNLGVVFLRVADFARAEQCFRRAIQLNQQYVNAYCNLGTTYALANRWAEAVQVYQRALELFPNCAKAHAELGAIYLSSKLARECVPHLKEAIKLSPQDSRSVLHLAQALQILGQPLEAVGWYQRFSEVERERYQGELPDDVRTLLGRIAGLCDRLTQLAFASPVAPPVVSPQAKPANKIMPAPEVIAQASRDSALLSSAELSSALPAVKAPSKRGGRKSKAAEAGAKKPSKSKKNSGKSTAKGRSKK